VRAGWAVILDPGTHPSDDPHPLVVTANRWAGRLSMTDFPIAVQPLGRVRLPKRLNHRSPQERRDIASSIHALGLSDDAPRRRRADDGTEPDTEVAGIRDALRRHPCHQCPDREEHARWAERHARLQREVDGLRRRIEGRTDSLGRMFDLICRLLTDRGYLAEDEATPAGRQLSRIWSESDLLIAECLRAGVWTGLDAAELAAVCAAVVYEARRDDTVAPKLPAGKVRDSLAETVRLWAVISEIEAGHGLPTTREPDLGFVWASYRWAKGEPLDRVLTSIASHGPEMPAGDFVRWMRQLLDLLEQLSRADAIEPSIRNTAAAAVVAIRRGVIAQQV